MSANLWALHKDRLLRTALLKLHQRFGGNGFVLSDRRCDHPGAVVLCKLDDPDLQAYIYTFGQEPDTFGLQLEYPSFSDTPPPAPSIHEHLSFNRLADLLRIHFDVA